MYCNTLRRSFSTLAQGLAEGAARRVCPHNRDIRDIRGSRGVRASMSASKPLSTWATPQLDGVLVRRLGIKKTPYAVYYYVDEAKREAVVISIWIGQRGDGPPLRVR